MRTPGGALPTIGGGFVEIEGRSLGLSPGDVSLTYTGALTGMAVRTFFVPRGTCTIAAAGTLISCPTPPGVGANYTVVVTVGNGTSAPGSDILSYAPPIINSVDGAGAVNGPAIGGAEILIRGVRCCCIGLLFRCKLAVPAALFLQLCHCCSCCCYCYCCLLAFAQSNFGPAGRGTEVQGWASPATDSSLRFLGLHCVVLEAHVTIQCITSPCAGAALTWRVVVEGQSNAVPLASVAPPTAMSASLVLPPQVAFADTLGGTHLVVEGVNFGLLENKTSVSVTVPAGALDTTGCVLAVPDSRLRCVLLPGTGVMSHVTVTVLGQSHTLAVTGLAYAPPTVSSVAPSSWPTDLTYLAVTLTGSGFGSVAQSDLVRVLVAGASGCGVGPALSLTRVNVRDDSQLTFALHHNGSFVASTWQVLVTVSGVDQVVPVVVSTRAPAVSELSLDNPSNGTHYFVLISGTDFGRSVTPEDSCGTTVTVDGAPCAELTTVMVSI